MYPGIVKNEPGRPITGSTGKDKLIKVRVEQWMKDELKYACRMVGCSDSEGIRRGIALFIKSVHERQHY